MTGKFMITLRYLREIGACAEGRSAFEKAFPDGGEYQAVLDKCAEEGRMDFASWLLHKVGSTDDVRTYEEQINDENMSICFAGALIFKKGARVKHIEAGDGIEAGLGIEAGWGIEAGEGIEAGWGIEAGCGIEAGWGIEAGEGIKAGCGIEAGWGIEAGEGYGIFAGLKIKLSNWSLYARVSASCKPTNLISGYWVESENRNEANGTAKNGMCQSEDD